MTTKRSSLNDGTNDNYGLFAVEAIAVGTVICSLTDERAKLMNDGAANLDPIIHACTSSELYSALLTWEQDDSQSERNNVVITDHGQCVAVRSIAKGEELLRPYPLTSWICQILKFVTSRTFPGYVKFFHEMSVKLGHSDLQQIDAVFIQLFGTYGHDLDNLNLVAAEHQLRGLDMAVLRQHLLS